MNYLFTIIYPFNTLTITVLLRVFNIFLVQYLTNARKQCFNLEHELDYCSRKHKIHIPTSQLSGYSFGYGSLNDTEYMCRTRWHILVFHCMRKRAEESCNHSDEEKFRQIIWSISLDTRKFEKAAAYICHEHNLRILREHQYKCLRQQEKLAEQCAVHRNETIKEVVLALHNQSSRILSSSNEYYSIIKQTLTLYECKSLRTKLDCLYNILHNACPSNAVRLIMNYFKETLPDGCTFNYETRLSKHLESLQMTQLINNDENVDEKIVLKQTANNNLHDIQASPRKSRKNYANLINYNFLNILLTNFIILYNLSFYLQ
ncbi:Peptidase S1 S6 chymotrypsin Hap active site [Schistosoma japonicum]|nr:Peptidase S1 S6 chymotrypsin Hap active site [Schistosoma japonicum]